jgi:hypothetical protein
MAAVLLDNRHIWDIEIRAPNQRRSYGPNVFTQPITDLATFGGSNWRLPGAMEQMGRDLIERYG